MDRNKRGRLKRRKRETKIKERRTNKEEGEYAE